MLVLTSSLIVMGISKSVSVSSELTGLGIDVVSDKIMKGILEIFAALFTKRITVYIYIKEDQIP